MKPSLILVLFVAMLGIRVLADEKPFITTIDRDPKTMADFNRIVQEAAGKGAIRVQFPSGEWNWHCSGHIEFPKKENLSKWASNAHSFDKKTLEVWLKDNKVVALQMFFGADIDPKIYFTIEKILRRQQVYYWVAISLDEASSSQPREAITLLETDGKARTITQSTAQPEYKEVE